MGTYRSIFEISGKLGDEVFYLLNGKPVVRKIGRRNKNSSSKGLQKVAQQNTEFAKASAAGKFFRQAMKEELECFNDRYLYQKINQLMLNIKNCDTAVAGEKTVNGGLETLEGADLFANFPFAKHKNGIPKLLFVQALKTGLKAKLSSVPVCDCQLIELQINLDNGKFRKNSIVFPSAKELVFKKAFRKKKGCVSLFFVFGEDFLSGVVLGGEL